MTNGPSGGSAASENAERWALILGASSGFGGATGKALAREGYGVVGVHLDLRGTIAMADAVKRAAVIADTVQRFEERRRAGADPYVAVFLHSLAFGATLPYVRVDPEDDRKEVSRKQLEMTADVMAHSMVYWTRDLYHAGLLRNGSRVFAMTSEGALRNVPTYGPVSAAKAALESHCRQLAMELIPC